jgi:hypothetical protein
MRAAVMIAGALAVLGCARAPDPCAHVAGTCVALTVTSRSVSTVDSLRISGSGVATGSMTSTSGKDSPLPIRVALVLPAADSGSLHLEVSGLRGGVDVGHGQSDANVVKGQHVTATADLASSASDLGASDLSGSDGGADGAGGGQAPDMLATACDPNGVAGPQCRWSYQLPRPTGESIVGVYSRSDTEMFAATGSGAFLRRDGTGWSTLDAAPQVLGKTFFPTLFTGSTVDKQTRLFAGGALVTNGSSTSSPAFFSSSDEGQSWVQEILPATATGQLLSIAASNMNVLIGCSGGIILRRSDSGIWSAVTKSNQAFSAALMTTQGDFVAGAGGSMWRATPLQSDWAQVPTTATTNVIAGMCHAAGRFWGVGSGGTIITAADADAATTWTLQTSNAGAATKLVSCAAMDQATAWAVSGANVNILVKTSNGGVLWGATSPGPDTSQTFGGIDRSPGGVLTIYGSGQLQRSTDGGGSFTNDGQGRLEQLTALAGVAPHTLYAVGKAGLIYRTADDGASWTKLSNPGITEDLAAVWGSSTTDVYVVGRTTLAHSTDGVTFTKPTSPFNALLVDIAGTPATGVFAVGFVGATGAAAYRSTDNGTTWSQVTVGGGGETLSGGGFNMSVFGMGNELWIGAGGGQIFHTGDGATWTKQPIDASANPSALLNIGQIRGRAPGHLLALTVGDPINSAPSALIRTTDGAHWTVLPSTASPPGNYRSLAFDPTGTSVWIAGSQGGLAPSGLLVSRDEGSTWQPATTTTVFNPVAANTVYAFGDNNLFLLTNTAGSGIVHYGLF